MKHIQKIEDLRGISIPEETEKITFYSNKKLISAFKFAMLAHKDQYRASGTSPYINHPLDVYLYLVEREGILNEDILAAALLHDTLEDSDATIEQIDGLFGKNVAEYVGALTNEGESYLDYLLSIRASHSIAIFMIKRADMICNYRDTKNIPKHKTGMIKGLKLKSELSFFILTGEKIENYIW